ncbi:MAG TPA: HEPN domain-containing protein [Blastocatellia bacterium]|nr:HEPN domain-containing protein [Blastocatellia bacterium]
MKPETVEWVQKAEGDWNAANQLNRVRKDPNYDGVCFHCQQCAEKYLKARLEEAGITFARTHDLLVLHQLVLHLARTTSSFDFSQSFLRRVSLSRTHRD